MTISNHPTSSNQKHQALVRSLNGHTPIMGESCFLAETAVLIGQVKMGNHCSIWYNAVLRGDVNFIELGHYVNVQDNATLHGTYQKFPIRIGDYVSIGHNAVVHGCTIDHHVLIGMGAVILDEVMIHPYALIAAGAVVTPRTNVGTGELWAGNPAKKIKMVPEHLRTGEIERIANNYQLYRSWYLSNQ